MELVEDPRELVPFGIDSIMNRTAQSGQDDIHRVATGQWEEALQ